MSKTVLVATISAFLLLGGLAFAGSKGGDVNKTSVRYAGFAFAGQFKDIASNFKFTKKLLDSSRDNNGISIFDKKLLSLFKENAAEIKKFDLIIGGETDSKIAMAVVVERENVSVVKIAGYNKVVINLLCNVDFLDFENFQLVGSFPIYLEYIDVKEGAPPDDAYISELFTKVYFADQSSIFNLLKDRMKELGPSRDARLAFRVNGVDIDGEVTDFLSRNGVADIGYFKGNVANRFTQYLSSKLGVAVLPYAKDHAGGKMSLTFSDARMQDFTIPDATYGVDLSINKFVKEIYKETSIEKAFLYGILGNVKVYGSDVGRSYLDTKVKGGAIKVVPVSQTTIDEFAVYDDLFDVFNAETSKEMQKDKKFNKEVIKRCSNM